MFSKNDVHTSVLFLGYGAEAGGFGGQVNKGNRIFGTIYRKKIET